ncbi:MAG: hypothetical protein AAFO84_11660 [Cyanobacteria bacterium J06598_1]
MIVSMFFPKLFLFLLFSVTIPFFLGFTAHALKAFTNKQPDANDETMPPTVEPTPIS